MFNPQCFSKYTLSLKFWLNGTYTWVLEKYASIRTIIPSFSNKQWIKLFYNRYLKTKNNDVMTAQPNSQKSLTNARSPNMFLVRVAKTRPLLVNPCCLLDRPGESVNRPVAKTKHLAFQNIFCVLNLLTLGAAHVLFTTVVFFVINEYLLITWAIFFIIFKFPIQNYLKLWCEPR